MNKKKLTDGFMNIFLEKPVSGNLSEKDRKFLNEIINERHESLKINPPDHLYREIIVKHSNQPKKIAFSELFSGSFSFKFISSFALTVIVVAAFFFFQQEKTGNSEIASRQYKPVEKGQTINSRGLAIESDTKGFLVMVSSGNSKNIFMKTGSWSISSDHTKFKKDTWFHYPGGGLKPIGTKFKIVIDGDKTNIELLEGKIQTYSTDEKGRVITSRVSSAPYKESFMGTMPENIEKAMESVKQSDKYIEKVEKTETPVITREPDQKTAKVEIVPDYSSVYRLFIGSKITVMDKNGKKISGVLKSTNDGNLVIKNKDEMIFIDENEMSLVDLDVHPDQLLFEGKSNLIH